MATKKTKPAKQQEIAGTERHNHRDVKTKAEELYEVRAERMELSKREGTLAGELIVLMKKHELAEHIEGDLRISVVPGEEKIKVKKLGGKDDE